MRQVKQIISYFDTPRPAFGRNLLATLIGMAAAVMIVSLFTAPARAEGLPGRPARDAALAAAETPWTGCSVGASAGLLQGATDTSSPINLSAEGTMLGLLTGCDLQTGRAVVGAFVQYGWAFGDLDKLGVNTELAMGGRAGYLIFPSVLVYGGAAWSRIDVDALGNVDGWKAVGGIGLKLPDAPLFLDLRYERGFYADVVPGLDIVTNSVRMGVTYKFNFAPR